MEQLLKEEKIVEIVMWSLTKEENRREKLTDPQLQALLEEFADVFSTELRQPPDRRIHNFKIRTVAGAKPQVRKHGRLSKREMEEMKTRIKELLAAGHIEPSTSPWSAPILFVRKKDGTLRLCIDYRALNVVTVRDEYPLPCIDAIFDKLAKAKFFLMLDLNMAYHQVQLDEESREATAFTCEKGHFQFKVMTFKFTNVPPTFQRMMTSYLGNMVGQFVEVYLDDILIYSKTWEEHLQHIREVLTVLRKVNLFAKASKCTWGQEEVKYLGHIIGKGQLKVDEEKVRAVREWKTPSNTKELQRFLELVNYYREFIEGLAKLRRPLYEVKDKETLTWTQELEEAFVKVKEATAELPYRVLWDPKKDLRVRMDASEDGLGLVLEQREEKGWWPLAFHSRTWRSNEKNWPVHHQEMMAFVEALQKWRHYLLDCPITAQTDSKFVERTNTQKITANRLIRWWEVFAKYNVKFEHIEGQKNIVADALSRSPLDTFDNYITTVGGKIYFNYKEDQEFEKLWHMKKEKEELVNGNLKIRRLTMVPLVDRTAILQACHEGEEHVGGDKLWERVAREFYWETMRKDCR